jgi:RNA polymerase sigma factor (sigma-70 family)
MVRLLGSNGFGRAESPEAFAVRAAVNLAFDWRRKQRRQKVESLNHREAVLDDKAAAGRDALALTEERDGLLIALDDLSPAQREVIVLYYLEQEPFDAIARQLKRSEHRVRGLCSKGLERLRGLMRPDDVRRSAVKPIAEVRDESR